VSWVTIFFFYILYIKSQKAFFLLKSKVFILRRHSFIIASLDALLFTNNVKILILKKYYHLRVFLLACKGCLNNYKYC